MQAWIGIGESTGTGGLLPQAFVAVVGPEVVVMVRAHPWCSQRSLLCRAAESCQPQSTDPKYIKDTLDTLCRVHRAARYDIPCQISGKVAVLYETVPPVHDTWINGLYVDSQKDTRWAGPECRQQHRFTISNSISIPTAYLSIEEKNCIRQTFGLFMLRHRATNLTLTVNRLRSVRH